METLRDRWRRSLKGRAWLEVRQRGRVVRRTPVTDNVITNLGLTFAFWSQWQSQSGNSYGGPLGFLATMGSGHNHYGPTRVGYTNYYDGTYYHALWGDPLAFLYVSTDATTPSASTNVLPGGTLIALGAAAGVGGGGIGWSVPSEQSVAGGGWSLSAIIGSSPSIGTQTTTSTLVTIPFIPYAGSGTVTVGSVGFTNGLYASTSSTTSWTAINGAEMSLTGSTSPASTKDLSIGSKLLPSTTLSVTNGEQLVVNYEISFTPA